MLICSLGYTTAFGLTSLTWLRMTLTYPLYYVESNSFTLVYDSLHFLSALCVRGMNNDICLMDGFVISGDVLWWSRRAACIINGEGSGIIGVACVSGAVNYGFWWGLTSILGHSNYSRLHSGPPYFDFSRGIILKGYFLLNYNFVVQKYVKFRYMDNICSWIGICIGPAILKTNFDLIEFNSHN